MFTLRKSFRFEASHQLHGHDGKCARLHGHSWVLTVEVRGRVLASGGPKDGMLADYGDLKALVQPLVDGALDHYHLNDSLGTPNPTSERVARWVYCALLDRLPAQVDRPWRLSAVEVEETCTSACRYEEPDGH